MKIERVWILCLLLPWTSTLLLSETGSLVHYELKMTELKTVYGPLPPVMHVKPGDTIDTTTVDADGKAAEEAGYKVNGPNPLTGPFYVDGAEPGDMLKVKFVAIDVNAASGFGSAGPGFGALNSSKYTPVLGGGIPKLEWPYPIDRAANMATFHAKDSDFSVKIPLHPFLGCVGVAPADGETRSSIVPAEFGGNMDAPEASVGNTLYLPVNVPGALLSFGDGHAAMGDGEVDGTAIEISMKVQIQVDLVKRKKIDWPRFENDSYIMAVGIYRPLDDALRISFTELVHWMHDSYAFSEMDAYELLSKVAEIHLDEMVDPNYVVVAKINKKFLPSGVVTSETGAHATGVIHTAQVDLGYETFGAGGTSLPVIAVNGGPGLSHAYMLQNDMWQKVAQSRMVVFYDQRGTGASKRLEPGAPQTMDAQVQDLEAVRAHFAFEKFALVGDSYGGLLGMAYAAAHPERVAKLVLSDSAAPSWKTIVHLLPQTFPDIEEQDAAEEKGLGNGTDAAARASLRNHFRMIFYSPAKRDAYMAQMGDIGFEPAVAQAISKATEKLDLTPKLASFRFPTLVISGRYDMNVAPLTAWRMAHAIPGAKMEFFEESGHLPSYEEPEKYRAVLEAFLNQR